MSEFTFKTRARLILQLGDQLIKNEKVAILELIKNSYDADSPCVKISMKDVDTPDEGIIIIEDRGTGMDKQIFENVWMEIGSDYKEKKYIKGERTEKFKRLPLGEKGIGRFAVHKLGNIIEIISKKSGNKEVYTKINWNKFLESEYLENIPIEILERAPTYFNKNETGTKIIISNLKKKWTKSSVEDLYNSIMSLSPPLQEKTDFKISFEINKEDWVSNVIKVEDIENYALFRFNCEIDGQYISKFEYKFTPFKIMRDLQFRTITEKDPRVEKMLKIPKDEENEVNLSKLSIGKIIVEGIIFDLDTKILKLGIQNPAGLKRYLKNNGGIKVYRNGIRVYDYGEPGNDWLNLDVRRVNIPAKRISNNILLGAVYLDRENSKGLIEKTNREGFIENEAYNAFKHSILHVINIVEGYRYPDKLKIKKLYGPVSKTEPVKTNIEELRVLVNEKIENEKIKKEINVYLDRIDSDYDHMHEILLRSAGAGLSLSVVVHEIDKIVSLLLNIVENNKSPNQILFHLKHLSKLIEGYSTIIKKSGFKKWDLKILIEQAIFNMEYRFKVHNIEIINDYVSYLGDREVVCARNLIISSIMNILDNSIWWLEYAEIKNKKILIKISDKIQDHISIVIADNGPGFALPINEITEPFVSAKPDGMGLGLHIVREIMESHGGKIVFPEMDEFVTSKEFMNGAIVAISFKRM